MQRRADEGGRAPSLARPGRLRRFGPLTGLALPLALLGVAAAIWWLWPCGESLCARPLSVVWLLTVLALPTGVLLGLPWTTSTLTITATVVTSAMLWLLVGRWAAVRASRDVDARWRSVWLELLALVIGVWGGVLAGLGVVAFVLIG